jgi:hypothetical protein
MARSEVADGEDDRQVCRKAVSKMNKESWTADKGVVFYMRLSIHTAFITYSRKKVQQDGISVIYTLEKKKKEPMI